MNRTINNMYVLRALGLEATEHRLEEILADNLGTKCGDYLVVGFQNIMDFFVLTDNFNVDMQYIYRNVGDFIKKGWNDIITNQELLLEYKEKFNGSGITYLGSNGAVIHRYNFKDVVERVSKFVNAIEEDCIWVHDKRAFISKLNPSDEYSRSWKDFNSKYLAANREEGTVIVGESALRMNDLNCGNGLLTVYTPYESLDFMRLCDIELQHYHLSGRDFCECIDEDTNTWLPSAERSIIDCIAFIKENPFEGQLVEALQEYMHHNDDLSELCRVAEFYEVSWDTVESWINEAMYDEEHANG